MNRACRVAGALTAAATLTGCAHQFGPYSERELQLVAVHGEPDQVITVLATGWLTLDIFGLGTHYYASWDDYVEPWNRYDNPSEGDRAMSLGHATWLYDHGLMLVLPERGETRVGTWGQAELDRVAAIRARYERFHDIYMRYTPLGTAVQVVERSEPLAARLITDPVELLYTPEPMRWAVWP